MNSLGHTCILLPLRLEIRKVVGNHLHAQFDPLPNGHDGKLRFSKPLMQTFEDTKYWIRWYPDDLALKTPPKPITENEIEALKKFNTFCSSQQQYTLDSSTPIGMKTKSLIHRDWDGNQGFVEKSLEIFNKLRNGKLSKKRELLCEKFQKETLSVLVESFALEKQKKPEKRKIGIRLGWKKIYDFENPVILWAWRRFIEKVGVIRARYLLSLNSVPSPDTKKSDRFLEETLFNEGITVLMPHKMQLFTINNVDGREKVLPITDEIDVDPKLLITANEQQDSFWLTNFDEAVKKGMGCKIKENIDQLEAASWLLAVGFSPDGRPDDHKLFNEILEGFWSRGDLFLTPQDAPTNNTEGVESYHKENPDDFEKYFQEIKNTAFVDNSEPIEDLFLPMRSVRDEKPFDLLKDSGILSRILGLNPKILTHIKNGGNQEQIHAESMGLLIWRSCTDVTKNHFGISSSTWSLLEKIFIKFIRARGPLPVLSAGSNPYGILPVMDWKAWKPSFQYFTSDEVSVLDNIHLVCRTIESEFLRLSKKVPTLGNADEHNEYDVLMEILRLHSVSKELWSKSIFYDGTNLFFTDESEYIIGNLVQDKLDPEDQPNPSFPGREYLEAIAFGQYVEYENTGEEVLFRIEYHDPIEDRIAILQPPRVVAQKNLLHKYSVLHKLLSAYIYTEGTTKEKVNEILEDLRISAKALLSQEIQTLEVLMMEIFDLLTFRLDAWISAFATIRMYECLHLGNEEPPSIGAYGWIEAPGKLEEDEEAPEYLQAPSLPQAATAALLRNGAIGKGAQDPSSHFHINLNSKRVREGSLYLDKLRQGYLPGEVLGYRLERMIHEVAETSGKIEDGDIYELRNVFRLPNSKDASARDSQQTAYSNLIDGKDFVESFDQKKSKLSFSREKLRVLEEMKSLLQETTDAAADLSISELTHQFMRGNQVRVGAWMDFLEGEEVPPELEFPKSSRSGSTIETKIFLSVTDSTEEELSYSTEGDHPYEIYDPALFKFCELLMPNINSEPVRIAVKKEKAEIPILLSLPLGNSSDPLSMNLTPMDLVFESQEDLLLSIRHIILDLWEAGRLQVLGSFPKIPKKKNLLNLLHITINQEASSLYLEKAASIRQMIQRFPQKNPLIEPRPSIFSQNDLQIDWDSMFTRLNSRLDRLIEKLGNDSISDLDLAQFGFKDFDRSDEHLRIEIQTRLNKIIEKRTAIENLTPKEKVKSLIELLPRIMGRPQAPFFVPYTIIGTTGSAELPSISPIPLENYAKVRQEVKEILHSFENQDTYQPQHYVNDEKMEIYYSSSSSVSSSSIILLTLDEWLEFIPNAEETSALAVRYSSPKSQAPNAILIATPPEIDSNSKWEPGLIAKTLASTLNLMKIRMLETERVTTDNFFGRLLSLAHPHMEMRFFDTFRRNLTYPLGEWPYIHLLINEDNPYQWIPQNTARRHS